MSFRAPTLTVPLTPQGRIRQQSKAITGNDRKTAPRMTIFELSRIIGQRAEQIQNGETPVVFIRCVPGPYRELTIAATELKEKKLPLNIHRLLPDGNYEVWDVNEMDLPEGWEDYVFKNPERYK